MNAYLDVAVVVAIGVALLLGLRVARRSGGRRRRTDVSPVSEQWLAERRARQD
jgi:hypothetical protein